MVKSPRPAAIGAVDVPRGRMFHMPGTGSQRYSSSLIPSRRGRRWLLQCQSSCWASWLVQSICCVVSMPGTLAADADRYRPDLRDDGDVPDTAERLLRLLSLL